MTQLENKLKSAVMRRVYIVYAVRKIASLTTFELIAIGAFLSVISPFMPFVSLGNVFANMQNITGVQEFILFQEAAIRQTEAVVQVSLVIFLAALGALIYGFTGKMRDRRIFPAHSPTTR